MRHFLDAKREFTQELTVETNFVDTGRILSSDEKKKRLLANKGHRIQPRRRDVESAAKATEPAGTRIRAKETRSGKKIPLRQPSLMIIPLRQPSLIVRLKRQGAESETSKRRTSGVVRARRGRNRKCRAVAHQRVGGMHAIGRGYRYTVVRPAKLATQSSTRRQKADEIAFSSARRKNPTKGYRTKMESHPRGRPQNPMRFRLRGWKE